ncbi:hypothetical protein MXD63_05840 [Frankia sp. Cpl3]|uniref:hypothetical protein n=1 Tax=Parafrankia colletiae TaxID=573497 RepID=UPI0008DAB4C6|nr:hypothetical protein [Parafrankia colletiae]MCK9899595.1 hypothetical protein [Frankia sp. Cpl3]
MLGAGLRQLAERQGAVFVDAAKVAVVGSDGVHLSLDSHRPLAELLAMAIRALPRPGQSEEEALAAKVQ